MAGAKHPLLEGHRTCAMQSQTFPTNTPWRKQPRIFTRHFRICTGFYCAGPDQLYPQTTAATSVLSVDAHTPSANVTCTVQ